MITSDSPINKQIAFYQDKRNYYNDVIKSNTNSKEINLWIGWIKSWNEDIIILKKWIIDNHYNECLGCKEKISNTFIECRECYLKSK